ncbi:hypothetical protein [Aeromonas veronii]|uniref:hypothetical protein n=1 Tax=Aeromonas veronii TaxID=654 RepID=UPI003DA37F62
MYALGLAWPSAPSTPGCYRFAPRHHRACYPTGFHAAPRSWQQEHGSEETLLEQVAREVTELRKNTIGRAA